MTVADAEEEDFQEALKEAVADKLGVDADDVVVTAVTADGKDGVKITYTVANVDDDAMDAAEGKLESASLASAIEDNLAYEGYKGADVSAATASVTTVEVSQIKAEQLFSGVTTSEAGEEAFQSALTDTVAAGLGLSAKEVSVTAVSEGKKGNVLVTYVITGVQTSAVASAERSIESTNMAEGIQKALHKAGYDDADVVCADVVPSVTDDDKPSKDDDKPSKDDDKPSKDDDKPSKDDDKKSDYDKPSTDDAATANAIEVSQEISGLTLKEAEDADFQEAFIDAVADALDVDDDDVEIEKVKACGDGCSDPDAVKIVYTVEVGEEDVASAEKTIEKDATAKALKKALKKQGYSVTVAPATAEPTTVTADDDDKPSKDDDKPSKDDDKPSKDDDKKSDDDTPSTVDEKAIEVSQEISGVTLKEAEDADFQEAIKKAVAAKLGVAEDDVVIDKVKACGDSCSDPDAVKVVYTVLGVCEDLMSALPVKPSAATVASWQLAQCDAEIAAAEKKLESASLASAIEDNLAEAGYKGADVSKADTEEITVDPDDFTPSPTSKPTKVRACASLRMRIAPPRLNVTHTAFVQAPDDDVVLPAPGDKVEVVQTFEGISATAAKSTKFKAALAEVVGMILGVNSADVEVNKVTMQGGLDAVVTYSVADNYGLNKSAMKTLLSAKGKEIETALMDRGFVAGAGHMTTSLVKGSSSISAGIKSSSKGKKASSKTRFLRHAA